VSAATNHVMQLLLVKSQLAPSCTVRESSASVIVHIVARHGRAIQFGFGSPLAHPKGQLWGREGRWWPSVLASFSPLSYPGLMTEPDQKLTLATPDDLADSLSFALRFEGRKSQHDSDRLNADIVAKRWSGTSIKRGTW
jgi:hypothetical protein